MRRAVYLTFNDAPGGIYTSQVIDVCRFLQSELPVRVTLIAFVSLRNYFAVRKKIRSQWTDAVVLPMWPGIQRWRKNTGLLRRALKKTSPAAVIARGPFATLLARSVFSGRVCFDARGAYAAEFAEYKVGGDKLSDREIKDVEEEALRKCDCAVAVSEALVNYWKNTFSYSAHKHVIIPCTLAKTEPLHETEAKQNVRIVFSGGNGKWQSMDLISPLLMPVFESDSKAELLLLTPQLPDPFPLKQRFADRVSHRWVAEKDVHAVLASCDYGWLYRSNSVTNAVASPVKFAEYLNAGLSVIISPELGDFSMFVEEHGCGIVADQQLPSLPPLNSAQRVRNHKLAEEFFMKKHYVEQYKKLLG